MISSKSKYKFQKAFFIVLSWIVGLNLYVLVRYHGSESLESRGLNIYLMAFLGGIIIGFIIGIMEVFVYPILIRKTSFGINVFIRSLGFLVILLSVSVMLIGMYYYKEGSKKIYFESVNYFTSGTFVSALIYCLFISAIIDFIIQVNQRMGPGSIQSMLNGTYFHPRVEDRIFMFLDMESSTNIAEKLGHVKFSQLLQDSFQDLSDLTLNFNATVYQFVGDEVVLTWKTSDRNASSDCIQIFYEFEKLIRSKATGYMEKYGLVPKFCAGVNAGKVTAAEVGDLKSELAFHGDVLNTCARVQKLCKVYNEKILLTENVKVSSLFFEPKKLAAVQVEGRESVVSVFSVERA